MDPSTLGNPSLPYSLYDSYLGQQRRTSMGYASTLWVRTDADITLKPCEVASLSVGLDLSTMSSVINLEGSRSMSTPEGHGVLIRWSIDTSPSPVLKVSISNSASSQCTIPARSFIVPIGLG